MDLLTILVNKSRLNRLSSLTRKSTASILGTSLLKRLILKTSALCLNHQTISNNPYQYLSVLGNARYLKSTIVKGLGQVNCYRDRKDIELGNDTLAIGFDDTE